MQKAILTFTDKSGGKVDVKLTFEPAVKGDAPITPAIGLGFKALKLLKKDEQQRSVDLEHLLEVIGPVVRLANRHVANLHRAGREQKQAIAELRALNDALAELRKPASDEEE